MFKQESNPLFNRFFSEQNADVIQRGIKAEVRRRINVAIQDQNPMDLFAIMSSVYSVNIANPYGNVQTQVDWMNSLVVSKCADQVVTGIKSYQMYIADISSRPVPNQLPANTSSYGKKLSINNKIGI
jgi:plasmid maintenance system killer protein